MAITVEIKVAKSATWKVKGKRIHSSSITGAPVHRELPKSRQTMPQTQEKNCCVQRAVEPQLVSQALELEEVDVAALLTRAQDQHRRYPRGRRA